MYRGSDGDDSPRNYSDSEDEGPRHGHHQQPPYPSSSSIRQPSGYGHGPNDGGHSQSHHATSQSYHSQSYGPPPNQNDRYDRRSSRTSSRGKSREHHTSEQPKEERRRPPREPTQYLTYLPGGDPGSSTLSHANQPGATTFVGDPRPYMHTDPNKPPEIAERAKRSKTRFQWYWPVDKVYGPGGERLIPFPWIPDIDGPEIPPGYAPIDENGNFLPYGEDVIREVNDIIAQTPYSQKNRRKKDKATERRERNKQATAAANQQMYQPPPPPPPHQDHHGRDYHHQEQRDRERTRERDREAERDSRYPLSGPSQQYRDPGPPPQHSYYQPHNQPPPSSSNPAPPQQHTPMNQPPRKGPALRILTLLIDDTRRDPGERDQLAEVRVPLKSIEGPEEGFWADANDVCKVLQSGPSRIDGPAKVYTLRGKYRQYFLRVNAHGEAEYGSANLRVDKDRTLQAIIEAIPVEPVDHHHSLATPQATPRPMTPMSLSSLSTGSPHTLGSDSAKRKRSDGSKLASAETHEQAGPSASPQPVGAPSLSKDQGLPPSHPSKKPRHNASPDLDTEMSSVKAGPSAWAHTYDPPPGNEKPVGSPESVSPARSPDTANGMDLDVSTQEQEPDPFPHQPQHLPPLQPQPRQASPQPQRIPQQQAGSPQRLQATFTLPTGSGSHTWTEEDRNLIEQLRSQISREPGYDEFSESRNKQLTMRDQLTQYTYIARQLGERTGGRLNVKKMHVMGVFNLPESWADTAQETLQLFALYGPGGSEFEDRKIIEMMDQVPPVTAKIQASKFLDRLRQLHRKQNDD